MRWGAIGELVRDAAERFGDAEAVVDGERRWSFVELAERVEQAARGLLARGAGPGERVGIWAPNSAEWIVAALGALTAGAALVPVNTRSKGPEAAYVLDRSGVRLVLTVAEFLGTDYPAMLRDAGVDLPVFLLGAGEWEKADAELPDVGADDLSDVMFTSGTTGKPKGVMSTHRQTLRVFDVWSSQVGLAEGDRYLVVNPFFHTFGYKAGILAALMRGATLVPHAVFDADAVLRRIGEERISMLPGPPTLYQSLLNHPELAEHDVSSLRLAVTGAAVVPVELVRRMHDELGFDVVLTAYGLTEATGVVSICSPDDDLDTIAHTCGTAIPDTEVRIAEDGEVLVRGYNVMRGYLDDPVQTAEAIDADGWLHTGDVGVLDERGYLKITDRKKDMFICGGFNAYPAEIENALCGHPAVAQAAVIGVPDERLGEVGMAFVVPRTGTAVDPDELVAWARERMANFKAPRRVEVVEALPTNASGKVLKDELRQQAGVSV